MGSPEATNERHDLSIGSLRDLYSLKQATPMDVVNQIYDHIESYPDKAIWTHLVSKHMVLEAASSLILNMLNNARFPHF